MNDDQRTAVQDKVAALAHETPDLRVDNLVVMVPNAWAAMEVTKIDKINGIVTIGTREVTTVETVLGPVTVLLSPYITSLLVRRVHLASPT